MKLRKAMTAGMLAALLALSAVACDSGGGTEGGGTATEGGAGVPTDTAT